MKIGIIGTGLIGGSIGLCLKANFPDKYKICGFNRNIENSLKAKEIKAIDEICDSIGELTENSDVVIICAPVATYKNLAEKISPYFNEHKVLTDVGSVKELPMKEFKEHFNSKYHRNIISCHPIAGKESGGIANAEADLFKGKKNIICLKSENILSTKVREIWSDVGLNNIILEEETHDIILAKVSHFPQYLSYTLKPIIKNEFPLNEFMRLSNSPFNIWSDIFHYNEAKINEVKRAFLKVFEIESSKFFAKSKRTETPNIEKDEIFASLVAYSLNKIVDEREKEFAGSGYASFTSILKKNILQKPHTYSTSLEKNVTEFIDELKNSSIPRHF